jgi:ADP-heptose:LPS heptosyltransferase
LAEVLRAGGLVDECVIYTAWLMDSSPRNLLTKMFESWGTLVSAARKLRVKKLDAFFDLRPWSPNAWLLAHLSRAKLRVGYGLRGMADVYNCIPAYSAEKSTGQTHLDALQVLTGENYAFIAPVLPPVPEPAHLKLPESDYIVAQLFSREAARNIPVEIWKDILLRLARRLPIVLVGAPVDAERAGNLIDLPGVISLIGRTSICDMLGVIQQSRGVVSIDSFAPHVGLAYAKKVAVLMVENTSNNRSFPKKNPNLKFVRPAVESGEAIEHFFNLVSRS